MSDVAIRVEYLSKCYRLGQYVGGGVYHYRALRDVLADAMYAPFRWLRARSKQQAESSNPTANSHKPSANFIWALKDVSFEVKQGEIVGIIGRNGAGKTTLLKVLSRITEPTEGRAEMKGRVGSLLEVGTGFHPELTGRENVYLSGAILGMAKKEIDRKFDEIVDFSEIEKFIDTPVKRYSSGMLVRLGFAVAAHLEPDILLVDEVLAVGDAGFQKKCLGKMENVAKGGRTVLVVSHNMGTISTLCERAVLLAEGHIDFVGSVQEAVSKYLGNLSADAGLRREWFFEEAPGGENVKVKSVAITDHQGVEKPYFSTTQPIFVTIEYWMLSDGVPVNTLFWLFDEQNNWICSVGNFKETLSKPIDKRGLYRSRCIIPGNLLNSGKYSIAAHFSRHLADLELHIEHCVTFETVDNDRAHSKYGKWSGIIKPDFEWKSEKIGDVERTRC